VGARPFEFVEDDQASLRVRLLVDEVEEALEQVGVVLPQVITRWAWRTRFDDACEEVDAMCGA
jgi:hypothetical protein